MHTALVYAINWRKKNLQLGKNFSLTGEIIIRCPSEPNPLPMELKNVARRFKKTWATFSKRMGNIFRNYGQRKNTTKRVI